MNIVPNPHRPARGQSLGRSEDESAARETNRTTLRALLPELEDPFVDQSQMIHAPLETAVPIDSG